MRLTKNVIERAEPPEPGHKERFLRDDEVRGLGLRITDHGAKSWIFEARIKGRPWGARYGRAAKRGSDWLCVPFVFVMSVKCLTFMRAESPSAGRAWLPLKRCAR